MFEVFTNHFNTRCQMVTPLLYSVLHMHDGLECCHPIKTSREYFVYYIGNVSLMK